MVTALIFYLSFKLIIKDDRVIWMKNKIDIGNIRKVNVKQSFLGRLLDYGTVRITDLNGHEKMIKNIQSPLSFQKIMGKHIS